jgi:hypothetical protein
MSAIRAAVSMSPSAYPGQSLDLTHQQREQALPSVERIAQTVRATTVLSLGVPPPS